MASRLGGSPNIRSGSMTLVVLIPLPSKLFVEFCVIEFCYVSRHDNMFVEFFYRVVVMSRDIQQLYKKKSLQ